MPIDAKRIEEHLVQWRHNRKFISQIPGHYADWIVTVAFYTALHAVEAILTADGARPRSSHKDRHTILQAERRYQKIHEDYCTLYDLALVARYSASPAKWLPPAEIDEKVIRGTVYPIEASVRRLLAGCKPPVAMPDVEPISLRPL